MAMTRSELPELTQAGINVQFMEQNKKVEDVASMFFGVPKDYDKKSASYKFGTITSLGNLRRKTETNPGLRDKVERGKQGEIYADSFQLGFEVSRELKDDARDDVMMVWGGMLGKSAAESFQYSAAVVFGRAFGAITANTAYPLNTATSKVSATTQTWLGPDGCSLCYSAHTIEGTPTRDTAGYQFPATYSNANNVALTESGLQALILRMDMIPDSRGRAAGKKAHTLLVPTALRFTASQLLNSASTLSSTQANPYSSGVRNLIADENITLKSWEKLIDPGAYFLLSTDCKDSLIQTPRDLTSPLDYDHDTQRQVYTVDIFRRWAFGWKDPRVICGSTIS